jgi:hypothetical protein
VNQRHAGKSETVTPVDCAPPKGKKKSAKDIKKKPPEERRGTPGTPLKVATPV